MTMSMLLLHLFVWITCIWVSRHIVSTASGSPQNPDLVMTIVTILPGVVVAATFLACIKLPDGRYLYRQWEGENLQFMTSRQMWLLFGACLIVAALPAYWLFWPYVSDWLNAR